MISRPLKQILALAATALLAFGAEAKNYDPTPVFSQDFEDAGTYAEQITNGSYVWTNSTDVVAGTATAMSQGSRTDCDGNATQYAKFARGSSKDVKEGYIFTMPSAAQTVMDYKIEFDWYISSPFGNNSPAYTYYQIVGANDFLMRIEVTYSYNQKLRTVEVLNAVGESVGTITIAGRDSDPSQDSYKEAWNHFIVYGSDIDGVKLDVVGYDGKAVITGATLSPEFDRVKLLSAVMPHKRNSYALNSGLDNVVVYKAAESSAFTWSGAAGDCKWSTPGNWTVGGVAQTELCPSSKDTAVVAGEGLSITAEVGLAVSNLNFAAGSRLFIDVNGVELNKQVTLLNVKENVGAALTAENVLATGYSADACVPKVDFSAMPITVILYDKSKFFWTGKGGNTLFSTLNNWAYGATNGPAAATAPTDNSTVTFPESFAEGVTVTFNGNTSDKGLYFVLDCDVTFARDGTTTRTIYPWSITGTGALSLANDILFQTVTYKNMAIGVDVNVLPSDGDDPWARCATIYLRGKGSSCTFTGGLGGAGRLALTADTNPGKSYTFAGDMSDFTGKLDIPANSVPANVAYRFAGDDNTLDLAGAAIELGANMVLEVNGTYTQNALKVGVLTGAGSIKNGTTAALTLEVGALNADAETSVTLTNNDVSVGSWTIKKMGTGCQTFTSMAMTNSVSLVEGHLGVPAGKEFDDVARYGGSFKFKIPYDSPWTNGTACTLFTCSSGVPAGTEVDYVTLDMSAYKATYKVVYDNSVANTLKVTLISASAVWNGPVNGRWSEASNWLVDGKPASAPPGAGNAVEIGANAVILVDPDQQFGYVDAHSSVKLAVLFTDSALTFTAPTGFAGTIEAAGPYAMTVSAGVYTATRVPSTFVWVGSDGDWSDLANWKVGAYPPAVKPGENDSTVFPASLVAVAVTMNAESSVSNVWTDAQLTLRGPKILRNNFYYGSGKLKFDGAQLYARLSEDMVISNDIEVAEDSTNHVRLSSGKAGDSNFARNCHAYGDITGSGTLQWSSSSKYPSGTWAGMYFHGDNTAFAGTFEQTEGYDGRSGMGADTWRATSSNAVWLADSRSKNNNEEPFFPTGAEGTYYFGAIRGSIQGGDAYPNFEIGHRDDVDSDFLFVSRTTGAGVTRSCTVTKVGTADLSIRCSGIGDNGDPGKMLRGLTLKGGATWVQYTPLEYVTFAGTDATLRMNTNGTDAAASRLLDPSAVIVNSTSAIAFDDQGTNATWTTALAASNAGGLIKKGAGTLTLSAIPEYAGVTKVEAGRLVMPDGAKVTLDVDSVADGLVGGEVTNALFCTARTTAQVVTSPTTVREFSCPVDFSNVTVNLTTKTDWSMDETYYVVTDSGVVAGTSITNVRSEQLILPAAQQDQWRLAVVDLPGHSGKKALAVVQISSGLIVTFE